MIRKSLLLALASLALVACDSGAASPNTGVSSNSQAGKSSSQAGDDTSTNVNADAWGDPPPATAAVKVGPGTPCDRSLTFDVPAEWRLRGAEPADLADVGGFTVAGLDLVCELDGKPAGVLGVMRVFRGTDTTTDLKTLGTAVVNDFGTADALEYRDTTVAGAPAVEIRYQSDGHKARAFIARVGGAAYAVQWSGFDDEEHTNGLPTYVLARTSAQP